MRAQIFPKEGMTRKFRSLSAEAELDQKIVKTSRR